ncbi:hypothetical protein CYLTODRAFT_385048 [Cylindrobasidium torrendii FP15055 ss-10]|uniref:Uncharacterized protein n=1 Tax=Cylindrobasidium torrendii FP15055 ss-10 TaxID=1314674 RepID=A0A0D7BUU7_9AGAR|nr:hypothetical protein CYLTODRAFT_385048 [Cylindrobasidium torrendii FP15055 ss-10]
MSASMDASKSLPNGKGKSRAVEDVEAPSERTPLLASGSNSSPITSTPHSSYPSTRLASKLARVFLITLGGCVVLLVIFALVAWSYAAKVSDISPEQVLSEDLKFKGPDLVNVLNVTEEGGIWVNVEGRIGFDAGKALGVESDYYDSWATAAWKSIGRWGIKRVNRVSIELEDVVVSSEEGTFIGNLKLPPQEIVLSVDPPSGSSWLQHTSTDVYVLPSQDTRSILAFFAEAWRRGSARFIVQVGRVGISGGAVKDKSWREWIQRDFTELSTNLGIPLPQLPGLPPPGRNLPFPPLADLITLQEFSILTAGDQLALAARASLIDPVPTNLNFSAPALPFTVSLAPGVPIAAVNTAPFTTTHPNITIDVTGSVLPLPPTSTNLLSVFLSRYLSGKPNDISISTPLIHNLTVDATFPGPQPKPQVLRNVTIQDMKLKAWNTSFLASGVVYARVVLPAGMNISINVTNILPDVLIFDGAPPDDLLLLGPGNPPEESPLPDPLPPRAFSHIRPDDWLESECKAAVLEPGEEGGSVFEVSARIEGVPLQVLPGREKEFGDFVSKVLFSIDGALAGLVGIVSVSVDVPGLPVEGKGSLRLDGLPFRGAVRLSKKHMFDAVWPFSHGKTVRLEQ